MLLRSFLLVLGLAIAGLVIQPAPSVAVLPDEVLDDPELESRARVLSKDIRCLVCQNQSIDDSNADLARDLRLVVRERLVAGDTDAEVKDFLVDRYGAYVLLTPPFTAGTLLLWTGPFVLVFVGAIGIFFWFRRQRTAVVAPAVQLSAEERKRLDELLGGDGPEK